MQSGARPAADNESLQTELERLSGELDAAIVFAVSAEQAQQSGNMEFCAACLSDARDAYAKTLLALVRLDLAGSELQDLKSKLIRLRQLLDGFCSTPARDEAAA